MMQSIDAQSVARRWLNAKEASEYLRVSPRKLFDMQGQGLKYVRLCRRKVYDVKDLDSFMAKFKVQEAPSEGELEAKSA